ncbi:hypothetical protein GIB67_031704 [Kingdonia uniflora]|uniref:Uncharacterized protein n=1 Tax=Kingdonia uniflora TaxID=39325 RepID=A0A7J7NK79_9MAGN|nr:hypothetical protein GIB67_031704 [Kingdonia uniflora]
MILLNPVQCAVEFAIVNPACANMEHKRLVFVVHAISFCNINIWSIYLISGHVTSIFGLLTLLVASDK